MNTVCAGSFDKISLDYEKGRPGYPDKMYEIINCHKNLNIGSEVLEIGAGNGVSTKQIYDKWLCRITAIEPGENLCALLKDKLKDAVQIYNSTFELFNEPNLYDAIFCGTAFHWLDVTKYFRTSQLLKEDGILCLYWNNYDIENPEIFYAVQEIYKKYHPTNDKMNVKKFHAQKITARKNELENSKYFNLVGHHEIATSKKYNSERYISLLKSFSNNSIVGEKEIQCFYDEIANFVKQNNDEIDVKIVTNLEVGQKAVLK